jgi:hypothetical protein
MPDSPDVRAFVLDEDNQASHSFLRRCATYLSTHNELSPRMAEVVQQIMAERSGEAPVGFRPGRVDRIGFAMAEDLPGVYNGTYTVDNGDEHLTYRIHTVRNGALQGQRIIKRLVAGGEYKGFGTLRTDGTLYVWRRFAEDESALYVQWARLLLRFLNENTLSPHQNMYWFDLPTAPRALLAALRSGDEESLIPSPTRFQVSLSRLCRRCNRELTTPTSVEAGIGPECLTRTEERTAAANPMEPVTEAMRNLGAAAQRAATTLPFGDDDDEEDDGVIRRPRLAPRATRRPAATRARPTRPTRMSEIDSSWEQ